MKNKKIWFVMVGIVAVGVLITTCNSIYLRRQSKQDAFAVSGQQLESGTRSSGDADLSSTAEQAETAAMETYASAKSDEAAGAAGTPAAETEILSPLETAAPAAGPGAAAPEAGGKSSSTLLVEVENTYRSRLDELDLQIQKMRSEATESTSYSLKTTAENELKLWDSELNNIYNDILSSLDEDQKKALVDEEREWMKERDATAVEAAKKSSGGTLEGLEYTASLAASTRQRAYDLASLYDEAAE